MWAAIAVISGAGRGDAQSMSAAWAKVKPEKIAPYLDGAFLREQVRWPPRMIKDLEGVKPQLEGRLDAAILAEPAAAPSELVAAP